MSRHNQSWRPSWISAQSQKSTCSKGEQTENIYAKFCGIFGIMISERTDMWKIYRQQRILNENNRLYCHNHVIYKADRKMALHYYCNKNEDWFR